MINKLEIKLELYKLMDSFLVEAKDQNGNDRSLEQLNQDRHLFVENCLKLFEQAVTNFMGELPQSEKKLKNI